MACPREEEMHLWQHIAFFLLKVVLEKKDGMWFGVRFYGAYGRKGMVVFSIIQLFEEKRVIVDIKFVA